MRVKSLILGLISISILFLVASFTDLATLQDYVAQHPFRLIQFLVLYLTLYFLRFFRNYTLFKINDFTQCKFLEYLPQALVAGTVSVYGPLKSGELVAMEIYHNNHGIERDQSLAVIASGRMLDIVIVMLLVASGLLLFPALVSSLGLYLVIMTGILVIVFTMLLHKPFGSWLVSISKPIFRGPLTKVHNFIESLLSKYYTSLYILSNKISIIVLVVFSLIRWSVEVIYLGLIFSSFGLDVSLVELLPIVGLSYAIGVSSGTPGALGTAQLTSLGILVLLGNPTEISALAIVISAAISVIGNGAMLLLGLLSTPLLKIDGA